jgi:hypothetical protein
MTGHPGRLLPIILTLLILLIVSVGSSSAQAAYIATLTTPDTSNFPHLTTYLDVHDPTGEFVHGLTQQDVTMQENGVSVPVSELKEQKPGVQFVIAITPGASFTIRDTLGISRYEYLLQGLLAGTWVSQPSGVDDFSLLTIGGPQLTHSSNPISLQSSLNAYQPNDPNAIPSLEVLASALQVASDPTPRPGMERAILFITPPQETDVSQGLQSIIASASQQNIHIFVWLVAAPEVLNLPRIDQLRNLANQTHAAFFAFSHDETIPDLETLLEPLRYIYQLSYDSHISTAGSQQVAAQLTISTELITTPAQSFAVNLQSPVPTLLNPPVEIVRAFSSQPTPGKSNVSADLMPVEQVLNIQIAFPDGYERPIARTRLYVDGGIAVENTSPPYDQFVWDLRPYTKEGAHTLSVEATDNLGMVGVSGKASVKIIVPTTTQGMIIAVSQKRSLVIGVTVIVSASILVLVLIVGGRIHPKPHPGQVRHPAGSGEKTRPLGYRERMRQRKDPLTQPVKIATSSPVRVKTFIKSWRERLPWLKRKEEPIPALAYLIPLVGSDEPTLPAPLQITDEDITLGSDPHQATLVITDPSIEGVHARIHHGDKTFLIIDAGSVAGTWVNYEQVTPQGTNLEHMDIIHMGMIGFRFKFSEPGQLRKVVITHLEPNQ